MGVGSEMGKWWTMLHLLNYVFVPRQFFVKKKKLKTGSKIFSINQEVKGCV
jgi:hypothetical protein